MLFSYCQSAHCLHPSAQELKGKVAPSFYLIPSYLRNFEKKLFQTILLFYCSIRIMMLFSCNWMDVSPSEDTISTE